MGIDASGALSRAGRIRNHIGSRLQDGSDVVRVQVFIGLEQKRYHASDMGSRHTRAAARAIGTGLTAFSFTTFSFTAFGFTALGFATFCARRCIVGVSRDGRVGRDHWCEHCATWGRQVDFGAMNAVVGYLIIGIAGCYCNRFTITGRKFDTRVATITVDLETLVITTSNHTVKAIVPSRNNKCDTRCMKSLGDLAQERIGTGLVEPDAHVHHANFRLFVNPAQTIDQVGDKTAAMAVEHAYGMEFHVGGNPDRIRRDNASDMCTVSIAIGIISHDMLATFGLTAFSFTAFSFTAFSFTAFSFTAFSFTAFSFAPLGLAAFGLSTSRAGPGDGDGIVATYHAPGEGRMRGVNAGIYHCHVDTRAWRCNVELVSPNHLQIPSPSRLRGLRRLDQGRRHTFAAEFALRIQNRISMNRQHFRCISQCRQSCLRCILRQNNRSRVDQWQEPQEGAVTFFYDLLLPRHSGAGLKSDDPAQRVGPSRDRTQQYQTGQHGG